MLFRESKNTFYVGYKMYQFHRIQTTNPHNKTRV